MITDWIMDLFAGLGEWFISLMPDLNWANGMVVSASNVITSLMIGAASIGAWFPWDVLVSTAIVVLGVYFALFGLKVVRWLWGLTPLSGGS